MNLLKETEDKLEEYGFTWDDVVWVGTPDMEIPLKHFKEIADCEYDEGYGAAEVATDLLVCGIGWWMERWEYDGSEGWEFHTPPIRPDCIAMPERVMGGMWNTLEEMMEDAR